MTLNPDLVRARASDIEESVARLERFAPLDLDEFISNQDAVDIACHRLMVAIEAALALCYHVSARRFRKAPEDYASCFAVLQEAGLLPADLTVRLQRMARFRNLLVHTAPSSLSSLDSPRSLRPATSPLPHQRSNHGPAGVSFAGGRRADRRSGTA